MGFARTARRIVKMLKNLLLALLFAISLTACDEIQNQQNEIPNQNNNQSEENSYEKAQVLYAVDGDTIWVDIDGTREKIRFVGVNTPELARDGKPAEFMAEEAKNFTSNALKDKEIYLEKDVTDRDKYDRMLRYIWLEKPTSNPTKEDIEEKTLNGILVKKGYAYSNYYKPDTKYQKYLDKIEKSAQNKTLGIWSDPTNPIISKEDVGESYLIKGNKNSKVYHLPEWDSYETVKEKNAVYFETEKEARDAGFRPAK